MESLAARGHDESTGVIIKRCSQVLIFIDEIIFRGWTVHAVSVPHQFYDFHRQDGFYARYFQG
jgi:hypothetical protein